MTGRELLARAWQRVLARQGRRLPPPHGTRKRPLGLLDRDGRPVRDPYRQSMAEDPGRHAAIMRALRRQVDELGPVTR